MHIILISPPPPNAACRDVMCIEGLGITPANFGEYIACQDWITFENDRIWKRSLSKMTELASSEIDNGMVLLGHGK